LLHRDEVLASKAFSRATSCRYQLPSARHGGAATSLDQHKHGLRR